MEKFSPERPIVKINVKKLSSKTNYEEILSYVQIMAAALKFVYKFISCDISHASDQDFTVFIKYKNGFC